MRSLIPLSATLLTAACAYSTPALNDIHVDEAKGEYDAATQAFWGKAE